MARQKYIYPSTELNDLGAIYSTPDPDPGVTTIQLQVTKSELLYDRVISTTLQLPYQFDDIKIQPNELAVSTSIFMSVNKLYQNFIYIHTNSFISSNIFINCSSFPPHKWKRKGSLLSLYLLTILSSNSINSSFVYRAIKLDSSTLK